MLKPGCEIVFTVDVVRGIKCMLRKVDLVGRTPVGLDLHAVEHSIGGRG
jgi:hypothetical protein